MNLRKSLPLIVVIRQFGGIGDFLMMSPVFRGLKEKYPKNPIRLVTSAQYMGGTLITMAQHFFGIDQIWDVDPVQYTTDRTRVVQGKWYAKSKEILYEKCCEGAERVIDLNNSCLDYELPMSRKRVPVDKPRDRIWCEAAGVEPSSYSPTYTITSDERAWAAKYFKDRNWEGKKIIGVSCLSKDKDRSLPEAKYIELLQRLVARGFTPVVIDRDRAITGVECFTGHRIECVFPVVERMQGVVSVDSGIMHIAGTVRTPVVGIFGPTDPAMRMGEYYGSAIDSRALVPCAPCWYERPCTHQGQPHAGQFLCLQRTPLSLVVDETERFITT